MLRGRALAYGLTALWREFSTLFSDHLGQIGSSPASRLFDGQVSRFLSNNMYVFGNL